MVEAVGLAAGTGSRRPAARSSCIARRSCAGTAPCPCCAPRRRSSAPDRTRGNPACASARTGSSRRYRRCRCRSTRSCRRRAWKWTRRRSSSPFDCAWVIGKITVPDSVESRWRYTVTGPSGVSSSSRPTASVAVANGGSGASFSSFAVGDDPLAERDRGDVPLAHRAQRHQDAQRSRAACPTGRDAAPRWGSSARRRHSCIRGRNRRRSAAASRRRYRAPSSPSSSSISS